jgi:AraC family transcriptional regulator, regulatory protein of adaptative response / methylated-DNA-[protein]-cysteine methyltransferase
MCIDANSMEDAMRAPEQSNAAGSDDQWDAVLARDANHDGAFVFAVRTTGIFCRPSCPSRRPKRRNVLFFTLNSEAVAAGFRACKRCKPTETSTAQNQAWIVEQACRSLETNDPEPSLAELAAAAGLSPFHFHRVFKAQIGISPKQYRKAVMRERICTTLQSGLRITEAVFESGFESASRFYDTALVALGMTASTFAAGAKCELIVHVSAASDAGLVTVALTHRGVCDVRLSASQENGLKQLRGLFPRAAIVSGAGEIKLLVEGVVERISEPREAAELPLDIRATAFQQRVWSALRKIPVGNNATCGNIAGAIVCSNASGSEAQACAANPKAVPIACHRVMRESDTSSGYHCGSESRRSLMETEASA